MGADAEIASTGLRISLGKPRAFHVGEFTMITSGLTPLMGGGSTQRQRSRDIKALAVTIEFFAVDGEEGQRPRQLQSGWS